MTMVVTEPCVGCKHKDCVAVCPCDSFHEGEKMLYINPEHCIDCEACIPECPVEAIFHESNVPPDMFLYIHLNAEGARRHPVASEKN
jgi:ferredoxin